MYRLPGLSVRAAAVVMELAEREFPDWDKGMGRPRSLTLYQAVRMTLVRLRRNNTYQDLGEDFGVTHQTAWNNVQPIVAFLADVLDCDEQEDLSALVEGKVCLVDGSLVAVSNWRHRTDLYSGQHRRYGMNIQVVVDLHGRVIMVSRAFPGSWHDMRCFTEAALAKLLEGAGGMIADKGYQGSSVVTPVKKKPGADLAEPDGALNRRLSTIRVAVEWAIAHLKNWRILATRYRSDLSRIDTDIRAVAGLQKLKEQFAERRLTFDRIKKTGIVSR